MFELCINQTRIAPAGVDAGTTLLDYLRNRLRLTGTKEGCASGDCGACTVVVGRLPATVDPDQPDRLDYATLNSCITPLAALHGLQVLTVDGVGSPEALHPVQAALVEHHGSQCGFCTPGFVMSLVGAGLDPQARRAAADNPAHALAPLVAGNLCRCTGYRSILEAAKQATIADAPVAALAQAAARLAAIATRPAPALPVPGYHAPRDETGLRNLLAAAVAGTRLVAGGTDLWLEATQQYRCFERIIDLTGIPELQAIDITGNTVSIGSAVTHERLLALFGRDGDLPAPSIITMLHRFASPQIRHRGTLGGNLANGSPIADWPPVLLALDATVEIAHADGTNTRLPLAGFWRGYRSTLLAPTDYLRRICFEAPPDWSALQVWKISKRHEDDISSVLGAFRLEVGDGRIHTARIAFGGVAATPVRLDAVETFVTGQDPAACADNPELWAVVEDLLSRSVTPISDVRASATYRNAMVRALLRRALLAAAGHAPDDLLAVRAS